MVYQMFQLAKIVIKVGGASLINLYVIVSNPGAVFRFLPAT